MDINQKKDKLSKIEQELLLKKSVQSMLCNNIRKLTEEVKSIKKSISIVDNGDFISDHCIIRFLERKHSFNFEEVKDEIMNNNNLKSAILSGATKLKSKGITFVIKDSKVVTCY